MNIVEAIELLEHKLFDQGRSEQYTSYDKLIDVAAGTHASLVVML